MAASVDSPSPSHVNKENTSFTVSSPLFSPASDKRFWSSLRSRIDSLLENRQCKVSIAQDQLDPDPASTSAHLSVIGESDRAKRMKEDSLLLIRGFDSIAHTLSQLSNNLDNALQGARYLSEPPTLSEIFRSNLQNAEIKQEDLEKQQNRGKEEQKGEGEETNKGLKRKFDQTGNSVDQESDSQKETEESPKDNKLKKAKNLAVSMATKAASLARELKSLRSDLCFVQERCSLLEEENRRLRDGFSKGIRPEEDDLMRLQMEALLAEKSRLANENANLIRENQCLHQLVEYHQLTSHDLSASYDQLIQGMCLDFSSPLPSPKEEKEHNEAEKEDLQTPGTNILGFSTSLEKCFHEEQM
ncbi:uncharacterized protein LOC8272044 [Ricinus communis]|uniref:Uncharacterized protein n=1 Tax=Ricinus communis TaxID=3988 RepID=B9S426_RICCO|nr:uncharacterized protein LOC8272044 [Ricinus communis]EEF41707.1 conserved hypothetical protein [Ricinus communis]|eukprot:XP_002520745.1 uncharacterized protein LOC8272044 [Ricinus communis]